MQQQAQREIPQTRRHGRTPAPVPRETPLGPIGLLAALRRNPLEAWTRQHFEEAIVVREAVIGRRALMIASTVASKNSNVCRPRQRPHRGSQAGAPSRSSGSIRPIVLK